MEVFILKSKGIKLLALSLATALMLTACGGGGTSDTGSGDKKADSNAAEFLLLK